MFYPTLVDVGVLVGAFGLFFTCFLVFIRVLPMIAMWEIKGVVGNGAHAAARPANCDLAPHPDPLPAVRGEGAESEREKEAAHA
jgi:molybdopterin-containing oxidoreductase family membrane subunit